MTDPATDPNSTAEADIAAAPPSEQGTMPTVDVGKEAAKYRRQLRDTEAQRDALAANVAALQRAEVIRQIRGHGLRKPEAIFAAGVTMPELLADDGTVDADLVKAATNRAIDMLDLAHQGPPDLSLDAGPRRTAPMSGPSWSEAISGRRNR